MKTHLSLTQGIQLNHNQTELRLKPQITEGFRINHNQAALRLKPQITEGLKINHNQAALKIKPLQAKGVKFLVILAFVVLGAFLANAPASAEFAILTVNTANDNVQGGCTASHCTLREAIQAS